MHVELAFFHLLFISSVFLHSYIINHLTISRLSKTVGRIQYNEHSVWRTDSWILQYKKRAGIFGCTI